MCLVARVRAEVVARLRVGDLLVEDLEVVAQQEFVALVLHEEDPEVADQFFVAVVPEIGEAGRRASALEVDHMMSVPETADRMAFEVAIAVHTGWELLVPRTDLERHCVVAACSALVKEHCPAREHSDLKEQHWKLTEAAGKAKHHGAQAVPSAWEVRSRARAGTRLVAHMLCQQRMWASGSELAREETSCEAPRLPLAEEEAVA